MAVERIRGVSKAVVTYMCRNRPISRVYAKLIKGLLEAAVLIGQHKRKGQRYPRYIHVKVSRQEIAVRVAAVFNATGVIKYLVKGNAPRGVHQVLFLYGLQVLRLSIREPKAETARNGKYL